MEAISGKILTKVSDSLLSFLGGLGRDLCHRDANLKELEERLQSLKPLIVRLQQIRDRAEDPAAGEWLKRAENEYSKVDRLRESKVVNFVLSSGAVEEVNQALAKLFEEAKAVESALQSSFLKEEELWKKGWESSKPEIRFGGGAVVEDAVQALLCGKHPWIAMCGMGGVGKTDVAREVFNDKRVQRHFTGGIFWMRISKEPPPTHVILKALCGLVLNGKNLDDFPWDTQDGMKEVKGALGGRKNVFIVLDDVWDSNLVKCFDGIFNEEDQGVILVTARERDCVKPVANVAKIIPVEELPEEQSWKLFSCYAFRTKKIEQPDLEGVARDVAKECNGLPLALRVIGSAMRYIQVFPDEGSEALKSEWENVLSMLQSARCYGDEYKELFGKLQLSVDSLKHPREDPNLFKCFCYFAAFPEDRVLSLKRFENLWIAEGLVSREYGSWNSQRQEVRRLLNTLERKSMIEKKNFPLADPRYVIHDVLRDLARQNLEWDFLFEKEILPKNRECLYAPALMSSEFPPDWIEGSTSGCASWEALKNQVNFADSNVFRVERLSLIGSKVSTLPSRFCAPSLGLVLLSGNKSLRTLPRGFFAQLSSLVVLDLSRTGVEEISAEVLRGLKKLRKLNLDSCSRLKRISDEVCNLCSLESLQYFYCGELESLLRLVRLTNLHTLSATIPAKCDMAYDGLHGWQWWSDYLSFRGLSRYAFVELFHLGNLRDLALWTRDKSVYPPDMSRLTNLESLSIQGFRPPKDIVHLQKLKRLVFINVIPDLDFKMPALDELPLLEHLHIEVSEMPPSFGFEKAFPSLRSLVCSSSINQTSQNAFTFCEGTMPNLESLSLEEELLQEFPRSVSNLQGLKQLNLRWASETHVRSIMGFFKEGGCFPILEELTIGCRYGKGSLPNLSELQLECLTSLKSFASNVPRERLPSHILKLEEQGIVLIHPL